MVFLRFFCYYFGRSVNKYNFYLNLYSFFLILLLFLLSTTFFKHLFFYISFNILISIDHFVSKCTTTHAHPQQNKYALKYTMNFVKFNQDTFDELL